MKDKKVIEARKMLCRYLNDIAKEKGLSTYKIADIAGFKQQNVSRMLRGENSPTLDSFIKLCDAIQTYIFIIDKDDPNNDLVKLMKERWNRTGENN